MECLKELPLEPGVTGSTPQGEDPKAEAGHAGGTTFPIQPWRTLVFRQRGWREAVGGGGSGGGRVHSSFSHRRVWTILRLQIRRCCMTVTEFDHFRTCSRLNNQKYLLLTAAAREGKKKKIISPRNSFVVATEIPGKLPISGAEVGEDPDSVLAFHGFIRFISFHQLSAK